MGDFIEVDFQEMAHIVVLTVHLKDEVDLFCGGKEALPIVHSDTRLNGVVDQDLLVESLCVLPIIL